MRSSDVVLVLQYSPFRIELYQDGNHIITMNNRNMMHFEQSIAQIVDKDSVSEAEEHEDRHQGKEVIDYGEDGRFIELPLLIVIAYSCLFQQVWPSTPTEPERRKRRLKRSTMKFQKVKALGVTMIQCPMVLVRLALTSPSLVDPTFTEYQNILPPFLFLQQPSAVPGINLNIRNPLGCIIWMYLSTNCRRPWLCMETYL